jgi:hypothetical protein
MNKPLSWMFEESLFFSKVTLAGINFHMLVNYNGDVGINGLRLFVTTH